MKPTLLKLALVLFTLTGLARAADKPVPKPPFNYVWGKAWHILPQTHSDESGYFSLCEGRNGKMYIGTAKYNVDAFLVEFDPVTEKQRIVVDVNKVCGLTATGYAAQSKIHTRNFVGPSGAIYVGSKQGYRRKGDTSEYPGGYVITYDPKTDKAVNLGMPYPGQGIIDVVADEQRGLIYVVTCEDQHWMVYDVKTKKYRDTGLLLTPYATTLLDSQGRANAITRDFQLAQFDPATEKIVIRGILVDGKRWTRANRSAIPTWQVTPDGRAAWLILMNDPTLIQIDLTSPGDTATARSWGKMKEGKHPDSRCALAIAPDGRIYAIVRIDNDTGFGKGYLHFLTRFDPRTKKIETLGVLAVKNPDFFDFARRINGKRPPWTHGYHTLPDGTLTPLYCHMALVAARDGDLYVTILYPFTLLRIDTFKPHP